MTQAYNLSQLANNLNSTGQLDATDGLVNAVPVANGGTGASTAVAARTNLDVAQAVYAVPSGGIIMWSGAIASIPTGWFLCNGLNATPNLIDRFVVAAGSTYAVGAGGGSKDAILVAHNHTINISDPTHQHYVGSRDSTANDGGGSAQEFVNNYNVGGGAPAYTNPIGTGVTASSVSTGVSGTNANMPPYYALAYIMKS